MNQHFITRIRLLVVFTMLLGGGLAAQAQVTNLLLHYTNTWRYLDTGADPGADWAQPAFNDSAWPAGPGPFGFDARPPYPYPLAVQTPLTVGSPATPAHFLRTHFTVTDFPPGVDLVARCYFDDAAVLFLNGVEVARWFVPSNQTFQTYSVLSSGYEGSNYVFSLPTNLVVAGDNVLAVEVHQNYDISSDIFWALKLQAIAPVPLVISRQPDNMTTNVGAPFLFDAKVEGGPAWYRWLGNSQYLTPWSKSSAYTGVVPANAPTNYQLIATNILGSVTSSVAKLTIVPDTTRPVLVPPAQVQTISGASNGIYLKFSERLAVGTISATNNYRVTDVDSGAAVEVFQAVLNTDLIRLQVGGSNWIFGHRYQVTVNRVQDMAGNVIATNSQVAVAWWNPIRLSTTNSTWHYHSAYLADPAIVDFNWTLPGYPENEYWIESAAPFGQFHPNPSCLGPILTTLHNQAHPSLFRKSFVWPIDGGSVATAQINTLYDGALCLYLNGREFYRVFVDEPNDVSVSAESHARGVDLGFRDDYCGSLSMTLSNLVAGTNWLCAAVLPSYYWNSSNVQTNYLSFGLTITADYWVSESVSEAVRPQLSVSRQPPDSVVFTWAGTNCILQRTISLSTNAVWSDVTPPTNSPVILPADAAAGFFRLRQP